MTWQPIETAPKDGSEVLLLRWVRWDVRPHPVVAGHYRNRGSGWATYDDPKQSVSGKITHWMPLPEPPEASP